MHYGSVPINQEVMLLRDVETRWAMMEDRDFLNTAGIIRLPATVLERKIEWQEIIVACTGEVNIGYMHLDHLWSYTPFIATIWVEENQRSQGVGRAMVAFLETSTREKGVELIYSSSQCDEAAPQAWHRRVGFEECGILAGHNEGIGEVVFRKRVG